MCESRRSLLRVLVALWSTVALLAPTAPDAPAREGIRVVDEHPAANRIVDLTVHSSALGREARVRLLTPDGWEKRGRHERWPVLYLFVGGDGDHDTWTREYQVHREPSLRDTLVVMPEMPLYGFYSDWWNHGEGGPPAVESFHLREVLPLLERGYGAGTRRAAAGESQGGFGALSYAARHPGLFSTVASYSGFVHPLQHPHAVRAGMTYLGLDWTALWGDPVAQRAIWRAHDPFHLAERLRGTRVHLSSGDGRAGALDPPGTEPDPDIPGLEDPGAPFPHDVISPTEFLMGEESRTVATRLARVGVQLSTHFYTGTHSPPYWRRELDRTLPMLLETLNARPSGR
ncbi:alpha/beta hydrolase family protein [Streptomyces thermospinosisporus]|uniref:Acyl-CoA:diacylglycerol acyltransferase n=1 Tax=Streptomyces thermospinosisporus TaxID=161482 RepID=A0ABN1YSR3_9ACTN